jgi:general secretion pathway protein G
MHSDRNADQQFSLDGNGGVLLAIALPSTRAKDKILRTDLSMMRTLINNYACDTKGVPRPLQDLVTAGYLRDLPTDPMTGSNRTWRFVYERAIDGAALGIIGVRSGSNKKGTNGKRYSDW